MDDFDDIRLLTQSPISILCSCNLFVFDGMVHTSMSDTSKTLLLFTKFLMPNKKSKQTNLQFCKVTIQENCQKNLHLAPHKTATSTLLAG